MKKRYAIFILLFFGVLYHSIAFAENINIPTVSITSPASGTTYTTPQTVTIKILATDNRGVVKVELFDGPVLKESWDIESVSSTYNCTYDWIFTKADNGIHNWEAIAYDSSNKSTTSGVISLIVDIETTPPTGSIEINNGAMYTNSTSVTLALSATDASGISEMCISNTSTCSVWEPYATSKAWTLTSGDGIKRVYVWYGDGAGNRNTSPFSDTITLDSTVPTNGTLTATGGDAKVSLGWSGFSDATSGIGGYSLVYSTVAVPASCSSGTQIYSGPANSFTHSGLTNGRTYYYRVCAIDRAQNTSSGATASATTVAADNTPPTGSIEIDSGATYADSPSVTLTLSATDSSGVTGMCISNTTYCSTWEDYATSKAWTLFTVDGTKTVYVWYEDSVGNRNTSPYSDTITLDKTAPADGRLSALGGDTKVSLGWSGFSDATSGIDGYRLVYSTVAVPASCSSGTQIYSGPATSYTHTGLTNGRTYYYRVCAIDNAQNTSSGATTSATPVAADTTPPTGSIKIDSGAIYADSPSVSLTLSATDSSGVTGMCISNTTYCSTWEDYTTSKAWTLSTVDGTKIVYVWYEDSVGNRNTYPYSDTITLDTTAPADGRLSALGGDTKVSLSWSGFSDATSGIDGYRLVYSTVAVPASCSSGTQIYSGPYTSYTHTGLTNGRKYYYRVCAIDNAQNTSSGATASATPDAADTTPPTGSIKIDSGATYANSPSVTLALSAIDSSGVTGMCISNTTYCSTWEDYTTSKLWTLYTGDGTKTVYVWYEDSLGNRNASPYSDTITLDTTAPANGTLTAKGGDNKVLLGWSGFSDATSGIDGYRLVYSTVAVPASCSSGTQIYSGPATSFTHTGLVNGMRYYYRVCAIDNAQNTSSGATASATPNAGDTTPPTGSIEIDSGAIYANSSSVTLALSATDSSGVTGMCISNTYSCSTCEDYATSKAWTLSSGDGIKTVYVWYEDSVGNRNAYPYSDTITLDTTAPADGRLSVKVGDTKVLLAWSGFSDAISGIESYRLVYSTVTVPASCSSGTQIYSGPYTSYTHTGLTNGGTYYYRVCATDNVQNTSSGAIASATLAGTDTMPPVGSIEIDSDATYADSPSVTLALSATDPSGVTGMCISNTYSCSTWEDYATSKAWTLSSGDGTKTVYVWYEDSLGNRNASSYSDTITLDTTVPVDGRLSATGGDTKVSLSWSGFSDATSGIDGYRLVYSTVAVPASCSSGTQIYSGPATSYTHTGLTNGRMYYYRVCAIDNVQNTSSGATASATPNAADTTPPTGSIEIDSGATYAESPSVTLTLSATDSSGVTGMCISNTTSCSTWEDYKTSKAWTLSSGDGTKTVYVWYEDSVGNRNAYPYSDTITLDTTAPSNGTLSAKGGDNKVLLGWSGFSDATSGIESYRLVYSTVAVPASCSSGTQIYSGPATSYTHTGLVNGRMYYYRVCAIDNVQNTSSGATASATPNAGDTTPPAGSVEIDSGATYAESPSVTLTLSATDPSGVTGMCISNTTSCSTCEDYATSKAWTLSSGDGTKTVYVWYEDSFGNRNADPYSDTITLDTTAPADGRLAAKPGDTKVLLGWSGFSDATSGIKSYRLVYSTVAVPASCSSGTQIYSGPYTSYTHTGLTNGRTYYYRVCATDNVQNTSSGATASATLAGTDTTPPTGSIEIDSGATYANSPSVTLALSATDPSGITGMCISNTSSCSTYGDYTTSKVWTLSTGDGTKRVYVWYEDGAGNRNAYPYSDTITLDTTAPANGRLSASGGDTKVLLGWSGFSDATSGIGGYRLVYSTVGVPASCSSGTQIYSGPATTYTHTGLTNGRTYYYRVCAIDNAQNTSSGATASATLAGTDTAPPTGSIEIDSGATYANSPSVTLALSATDPSGVTGMCISNTYSCSTWEPYATSKAWTLSSGDGTKPVYVWFKDSAGNANTSPFSDTIFLDTTLPAISITNPVSGTTYMTAQTVTITASASDNVCVSKVEFYDGDTLKGTSTSSPYTYAWTFTGVDNGTHNWTAKAYDPAGNNSVSRVVSLTVKIDITAPSVPTGLEAEAVSSNQIDLSWVASTDTGGSGLSGYIIYCNGTYLKQVLATSTSDIGLTANTQYCYTVSAYDAAGNTSAQSTKACATTQATSSGGETLWAKDFGGTGNDIGSAVTVDSSGNVVITGDFSQGPIDFGGGPLTDLDGMFLAKFSPSGVHLWSKSIGSMNGVLVQSVATDGSDNIFVTGYFSESVDFGGGSLNSAGYADIFLAKYSPDGMHLWSKRFGSSGDDVGYGVAVDVSGNVVVTGFFMGTVDFGGEPLTSYAGGWDTFVAKYTGSGAHLWSERFLNTSGDVGYSIAVDGSDNILLTGYFVGKIKFGDEILTSVSNEDVFLAKLSSTGTCLWSKSFGGVMYDAGYSIAVDAEENVVLTGLFQTTINLGGETLTSAGWLDVFVAKFSGADGTHIWSRCYGGLSNDIVNSVVVDGNGDIVLTGYFMYAADFGGGLLNNAGYGDIFVAKYSSSDGMHLWSKRFGGSEYDVGYGVAVDAEDNVMVTGKFKGAVDFGDGLLHSDSDSDNEDIFFLKLTP